MSGSIRRVMTVAGREWRSSLASPSGWIVLAIVGIVAATAFFGGTFADARPASLRSVLLACPPEEAHDLGLRMVSDRFDMAGWTTYFLGPDTPVEEIADAAGRLGVHAVVMSSSTHWHRLAVRHAVDELKRALPNVDVWVGGPAFALGAEGWSADEIVDLEALLGPWEG